jgi:preprotein translocase subunit SecE
LGGVLAVKYRVRRTALADKERKGRAQSGIQSFFRETSGELRKVTWPTWPEAKRLTWLVLIVMVVVGFFLFLVDLGAERLLGLLLGF